MATRVSAPRWRVLAAVAFLLAFLPAAPVAAQDRLCDPGGEDCRQILISHIRAEKVGLDVAFWFMEDSWIASEIINRWKAGVPVRVLVDTQANTPNPLNAHRLAELSAAGIPMRERVVGGILHWKMMLFEGQSLVQFSAANYSSDAWLYTGAPYTNYVDEVILFTSDASIVNSFRTRYDDLWVDTSYYADYANVTTRARVYGTHPIDPRLNFVPWEDHASRATALYAQEPTQIDVVMYRITDSRYADAMIAAVNRGVKVRLLTEPKQYRDPIRQYHSYNVDRMYMAGVEIRHRAHAGLTHQKSVLLHDLKTAVFGSSNWSSASSDSQEEHNLFTQDDWMYQWLTAQFDRKWNNTTGVAESVPFAPLAPDAPSTPAPAPQATGVGTSATLQWYPGLWAHQYDVYLGTDPVSLPRVASDLPLGPSRYSGDMKSYAVSNLLPGTTYYWRIAGKTMANQEAASPVWSFTTAGVAPPTPVVTLVRGPYLQQVSATGAVVVWATKEAGSAQLRVTPPSGSTATVTATSTLFPATATGLATDYYQHVAQVTGLSPSTVYAYDVLVSGVDVNGTYDTISTAPAPGGGTVSFVAFGDSGVGSAEQQQVGAVLAQDVFDLALHTGDIAYGNSSGTGAASHQTMDDWFFAMYAGWLRNRPFFPSMGNHDSRAANSDGRPYLDLFELPARGATATYPDHAERYYSFDYGPIHVLVLDTELAFQDPARQAAQLAWADADLASTTQPWKIALYHRSPYSSGAGHGSDLAVRQAFGPLFDTHGVQVSLSAHEHDYERTVAMKAGVPDPSGTIYLVTGGGGAPLYSASTGTWTAHSASAYHYVRGTATSCTLRLDAIGLDGLSFDGVTLQRCPLPPDAGPPQVAITSPSGDATVKGNQPVVVSASDDVGVTSVELYVDGALVATDYQGPFSFSWDTTTTANGAHVLTARAFDAAGHMPTSAPVTVNVQNPVPGSGDILLYAADATVLRGRWQKEADATAAGGFRLRNPDAGAAKRSTALANPADYFELTFNAQPNVPYRFWMRGKADGNMWNNDSVFLQFTGTSGDLIGTTAAAEYNLEDCSGCRIAEWGWQDNAWGAGVPSNPIVFTTAGPHTLRVQVREDGLSIDQIMFSPSQFYTASPGALKNDTTIYPRSSSSPSAPAADTVAPQASITSPATGATVGGSVQVTVAASDNIGVTSVELLVNQSPVGQVTQAPFTFTWDTAALANGSYALTARAVDAGGNTGISPAVTVTVSNQSGSPDPEPAPNVAPTAAITSPAEGATATEPASMSITASASDTDGTVVDVEFYAGTTLIGSDATAPYGITWSGVAAGTYALTARAIDNSGAATTSSPVTVTVSPATGPPPPPPPPPLPGLPAPWQSQDLGAVGATGDATATGGTFTVAGAGADIWGTADAFRYVWQRVSGDVDVVARVASVENVDKWVKAGVMIREALTSDSPHALMLVSPGKGLAFQRRLATAGLSTHTSGGSGTAPVWVKLERRGNTITAWRSANGAAWTLVGSDSFTMPADVHVGLAVSSHVSGRLATATFDSVAVTAVGGGAPPPPQNAAPSVTLSSPVAGASFTAPASIAVAADASDSDGTIQRVDFYADGGLIGSDSSAPYTFGWTNVPAGTYSLTARAVDNGGAVSGSPAVSVTVQPPPPPPLPSPWQAGDIGAVGAAGSTTESGGTFTVRGAGADIWNTGDQFHYLWQPITGDVDVIARVASVEYVHAWVKAGVMIRERLTTDSPHALMLVSPGKGLAFQRRLTTAGVSTHTTGGAGTAPAWVKLERRGNTITAYRSADGVAWTLVGSDSFAMGPDVFVGLAVSSHVTGTLATATFNGVTVTRR